MTDATNTLIARVAHEALRAYCISIGDHSQSAWDYAPEWQQTSARMGVEKVLAGATPEQLHEAWMEHKRADGWTLGEVKDPIAKRHPCMVPYAELHPDQRIKDIIFGSVVHAMAEALDMAAYR